MHNKYEVFGQLSEYDDSSQQVASMPNNNIK